MPNTDRSNKIPVDDSARREAFTKDGQVPLSPIPFLTPEEAAQLRQALADTSVTDEVRRSIQEQLDKVARDDQYFRDLIKLIP